MVLLVLLMSAFFDSNSAFTQSSIERAVLDIFFFQFLSDERLLLMKMYVLQTLRPESSFQIAPNWP